MSEMKTFRVNATYSVDLYIDVQASNKEEAEQKAHEVSLNIDEGWTETNGMYDFRWTIEENANEQ
jgi:hypothetical protein